MEQQPYPAPEPAPEEQPPVTEAELAPLPEPLSRQEQLDRICRRLPNARRRIIVLGGKEYVEWSGWV